MQPRKIKTGEEQINFLFRKGFEIVRTKDKKGNVTSIKYHKLPEIEVVEQSKLRKVKKWT